MFHFKIFSKTMNTLITPSTLSTQKLSPAERAEKLRPYLVEHLWDQPAVYCGTYGKYNSGSIAGAWLDLSAFSSYEEFLEICALLHDDEADPEFMFQDYQEFPRAWYDESSLESSFDDIIEYCQLSEDDRAIFDAYVDYFGGNDFAHFKDDYMGEFDSEEDFAEMIVNDCYDLDRTMGSLSCYFDYERFARDLFMTDYVFCDGYVFANR